MAEEFYNTFFNAFTSKSSEISTVTPKTITKAINENIKHDNFYNTHSKPPTLENIEDYTWWKERLINWAKAYAHESWFCLEFGYSRPKDDKGEDLPLKKLSRDDKAEFAAEQRMIALIQSSIRNDMFALLQHDGSSKSVREALKVKAEGEKSESHELELQKQNKMSSSSHQQNVESKHYVLVAEIKEENKEEKGTAEVKEKTREEILSEKTYRERKIALNIIDEMQEENVLKDDTYAKRHEKEIRYAMTLCLRKRDEERMKKNVEEMVINMKKVAKEVKVEVVEVEVVKGEAVKVEKEKIEEKVEVVEDENKIGSLTEVKIENLKSAGDVGDQIGDEGASDEKKEELKQTDATENTEVPITEKMDGETKLSVSVCKIFFK
ncbi:triadin-like [Helianthus annuus]|uniref:triadin-like n=1 Tax=Helianthus annuus TaxID=4232 RepID=UPI001652BCC0|nr:triadin-like [Helianthus annuus]